MKPATQVLIERYQKHLYAIAFNICRNQQDAEDVVQDTFIQYHTYKKEFDTEEHIKEVTSAIEQQLHKEVQVHAKYMKNQGKNQEDILDLSRFSKMTIEIEE